MYKNGKKKEKCPNKEKRPTGVLHNRVVDAYYVFRHTGNLQRFASDMARAGDVSYAHHAWLVQQSIKKVVPGDKITNFVNLGKMNKGEEDEDRNKPTA